MRAKKLPRLWCALQGLLPLEQCLAAQDGELGLPRRGVGEAANAGDGVAAQRGVDGSLMRPDTRGRER